MNGNQFSLAAIRLLVNAMFFLLLGMGTGSYSRENNLLISVEKSVTSHNDNDQYCYVITPATDDVVCNETHTQFNSNVVLVMNAFIVPKITSGSTISSLVSEDTNARVTTSLVDEVVRWSIGDLDSG